MKLTENVLAVAIQFVGFLFAFTLPIHPVMSTTLALVILDMITGMVAAKKEGQKITSHKFKRKIILFTCYLVGIFVAFLIETYMVLDTPLVKALAALVSLNEGKSIFENLRRITGVDLWKALVDKLQGPSISPDKDK